MIVTAKHRKRTIRLLTVTLILIGLTAALAACKQPVLTSISSGLTQACGLKQNGTPVCWGVGQNYYTPDPQEGEDKPPRGEKFTAISAGTRHTCGIKADGTALCWGGNYTGQATAPVDAKFSAISAGWAHNCGLRDDGTTLCWGRNENGQLEAPEGESFKAISNGEDHTCALREDGSAVCWGYNRSGQSIPLRREDSPASAVEPCIHAQSTWSKHSNAGAKTNMVRLMETGQPEFQP